MDERQLNALSLFSRLCDQGKQGDPEEIKKMENFDIPNYFV